MLSSKPKTKPKWFAGEQRGTSKDFPIMPAALTLYRIFTGNTFTKATGVKAGDVILELSLIATRSYVREDHWDKFCKQTYNVVKKKPDFQKKLIKVFEGKVPNFLNFCRKIYNSNLKKKTNKELWQMYEKYIRLYEDIYIWGEPFAFGMRFPMSDYLTNYLRKILEKRKELEKFNEYFNLLIMPCQKSFATEEKKSLSKLALEINKKLKLKKLFNRDIKFIIKEIKKYPTIDKKIEQHTHKFQWIPYNYGAYLLTKRHFIKEIKDLITRDKAKEELNKIKQKYNGLEKKQEEIAKKIGIDKYHQKLFESLRWNGYIIDYKKKIFTISHYYINSTLMKEISKRLSIKQGFAHCILEDEMKNALLNNKLVSFKILESRYKKSIIFVSNGKFKLMIEREADKFLKDKGIGEKEKIELKEVQGKVANAGMVKGKAKIIPSPKDFKKMKQGNILITHMTTPEFMPIIKKAVAIVTDEGGITCHAAIISREMNIPCVIGTKNATKVFKDNDLIEVNANDGIVKILNK